MKFLIAGGAGFIGSAVVRRAIADGVTLRPWREPLAEVVAELQSSERSAA